MNYRTVELLAKKDLGAAGTESLDLKGLDPISEIMVKFEAIVPASGTPQEHVACNVTKLEVVDGADVLYSLTGLQAQAVDIYDRPRQSLGSGSHVPAWGLSAIFNINFGRWLWDDVLALDPKRHRNPQLKISFDEDAAIASTLVNGCSVVLQCFDEKQISPRGFLLNKEVKSYVCTASGTEQIVLPKDYPIRKLYVQARVADLWLGGILAQIEIEEDNRKNVILNLLSTELEPYCKNLFPTYSEHFVADLNQTSGIDIFHAPTQGIVVDGAVYCTSDLLAAVPSGFRNLYKCATDIGYQAFRIKGHTPHGMLAFPMGRQDVIEDWWQAQKHDTTIRVKAGGSVAGSETFYVLTQQLRTY
jgi:hypothetical protein